MPIELHQVTKRYGTLTVIDRLSLMLPSPGVSAITGASGRGKTTLLRLLAGLEYPDEGSVTLPADVRLSYLFQEPRLLPWLTAAQNVNLVLGDSPATMPEAINWLERVELGEAASRYPTELSGGMQQRVALARALAYRGNLLLLDEPFRALDRPLRLRLYPLLREAAASAAVILVTHDPEDAEQLSAKTIAL